jgi:hypothetical protein
VVFIERSVILQRQGGDLFLIHQSKNKTTIMKQITTRITILLTVLFFAGNAFAQNTTAQSNTTKSPEMKTYVIERNIPGAGKMTPEQLKAVSQTSCTVLKEMGPRIQWLQSYVTGDKIYCIYKAENIELIKEHAKKGGFPANSISEVSTVISPATAEN